MVADPQFQPEVLLEILREGLHMLDDFRVVPHNDVYILRLKQHLRKQIATPETQSSCARYHKAAA